MGGRMLAEKPHFSKDQIINASDMQRKWKDKVVPKMKEHPFLMMFSGTEPKATVMSYEQFEELWERSHEASELRLELEIMARLVTQLTAKRSLVTYAELVAEAGILPEELEGDADVELESR